MYKSSMHKICVFGMYHLGIVTAASLASKGLSVVCLDKNQKVIEDLKNNIFPIHEPGIEKFFEDYKQFLSFDYDVSCVVNSDLIWVTFDTPVDDNDVADSEFVLNNVRQVLKIKSNAHIIVSSQLPVGSIAIIEKEYPLAKITCSPENLRLGQSIENFLNPDRIIVGLRKDSDRQYFEQVFRKISPKIIWMKTESAEMVKHTINAFLATCISFSNEISRICEQTQANIQEVEEGFRSEARVGKSLPLRSGLGFAGATLARDSNFLKNNFNIPLISSIMRTNNIQNHWCCDKIKQIYKNKTVKVGVVGLAYKSDTSTLRRSTALETCYWLIDHGHKVFAYDEHVNQNSITELILLCDDINEMIKQVDCVIIFSKKIDENNIETQNLLKDKIVLDPNGFYERFSQNQKYFRVGNCTKETW